MLWGKQYLKNKTVRSHRNSKHSWATPTNIINWTVGACKTISSRPRQLGLYIFCLKHIFHTKNLESDQQLRKVCHINSYAEYCSANLYDHIINSSLLFRLITMFPSSKQKTKVIEAEWKALHKTVGVKEQFANYVMKYIPQPRGLDKCK